MLTQPGCAPRLSGWTFLIRLATRPFRHSTPYFINVLYIIVTESKCASTKQNVPSASQIWRKGNGYQNNTDVTKKHSIIALISNGINREKSSKIRNINQNSLKHNFPAQQKYRERMKHITYGIYNKKICYDKIVDILYCDFIKNTKEFPHFWSYYQINLIKQEK